MNRIRLLIFSSFFAVLLVNLLTVFPLHVEAQENTVSNAIASIPQTFNVFFSDDFASSKAVSFNINNYTFSFDYSTRQASWYSSSNGAVIGNALDPQHTTKTAFENNVTYVNAYPNIDANYTVINENFTLKEILTIHSLPSCSSPSLADYFVFPVNIYYNSSLTVVVDGKYYLHPTNVKVATSETIEYKDSNNITQFYILPPFVEDSSGKRANATYIASLNNGVDLWLIAIPKTFIDNAKFPIYLDPSVVGSSSTSTAVLYPFQRKCFYANGRFWVFYSDGSNMVYRTSTDGSSWSSAVTIRVVNYGYMFSVWFDGQFVHYASAYASYIYYRRGTPNADGTITWSADEQTLISGQYPTVATDSNGYAWIGYFINSYPYVVKSQFNNGTWGTGTTYQLSTTSDPSWEVSIVPLTAGKMLAIYATGGFTVRARAWNGTAWLAEASTTSLLYAGYLHSAVAQGDDVHLVFLKSTGYDLLYTKYIYSTNSFSSETTLQAGATSSTAPVISINPTTNDLYVFWIGYPTYNHVYYRKYTASTNTWETTVDWFYDSNINSYNTLTCFYKAYGGYIGLAYYAAGAVKFAYLTVETNQAPTIGEFQSPTIVYANKYFLLNATINDADGIAQFVNATVEINGTIILKWDNATNMFSEYLDSNNYCTLDASGSIRTTKNTTAYILSWKIKLGWNYTEGSIFIISTNTKVFDSAGASGTISSSVSLFTFEDDLIIYTDATVSDSRVNPSQSITFTASIYYYGTTIAPEDVSGIIAYLELNGVQKGSDTDVTGGLSITINAESTVGLYSYNLYCVTDENSVQNQTVNVIVDRIKISDGGVVDSRIDVNAQGQVWFEIVYEYDSTIVNDGSITFYGGKTASYGNNKWWVNETQSTVGIVYYNVTSVTGNTYGITVINHVASTQSIIWDKLIVTISANSTTPDLGETVSFTVTAVYDYDNVEVTSWTVNIYRNNTHFASGNFTDCSYSEVEYLYTIENVTDNIYNLTAFTSNSVTVTWISIYVEINEIIVVDNRINVGEEAIAYYHCRWNINGSSCTTGTLYVNNTSFSINSTGWATVTFSFNEVCKKVLCITGVDVNGKTSYMQIPDNPRIVWDRVEMSSFSFSDGTLFNLTVQISSEYDGVLNSKNVKVNVYLNNSLFDTVNSVTNSSGYINVQISKNLYGQGDLFFDCVDLDDNINSLDKSNYLFSYRVNVGFLNDEVEIDKTSYNQGDSLTMTAYIISQAKINDTVNIWNLKLYNVYWKIIVKRGDNTTYGILSDIANKFNMSYANVYEVKTKTLTVTFPEGSYYLTAELWISGSDYFVNSADSILFTVHVPSIPESGGPASGSPIRNSFIVYIKVVDSKNDAIANANVTIIDALYNGTVSNAVTDNSGTVTFNLLEGDYYVIVEYQKEHKETFISVKEPSTFTVSLKYMYIAPVEIELNTQAILFMLPAVLGLILSIVFEQRKKRYLSIPLAFISIACLIYGGFVFFNILPFSLPMQISTLNLTDLFTNLNISNISLDSLIEFLLTNKVVVFLSAGIFIIILVSAFAKVNTSKKTYHKVRRTRRY